MYIRALHHPILGPKFGPIPNAKKYVVFSQFQTKNSQFDNLFFFFFFGGGGGGGVNTEHTILMYCVTYLQFRRIEYNHTCFFLPFLIVHLSKFNYWNQSSNGNIIHKDDHKSR